MNANLVVLVCDICLDPVPEVGPLAAGTLQHCSHTAAVVGGRMAVQAVTWTLLVRIRSRAEP